MKDWKSLITGKRKKTEEESMIDSEMNQVILSMPIDELAKIGIRIKWDKMSLMEKKSFIHQMMHPEAEIQP